MKRLILTLLFMAASAGLAEAQTVTGIQNISFGTFFRSQTVVVPANGTGTAQFQVTGTAQRKVRLTVTTTSLSRTGNTLPIVVTNSNCEYSIDGGNTWTAFTTGTLIQDVTLPANGTPINVRVGGSVTSGRTQQRGVYAGSINLNAVYK